MSGLIWAGIGKGIADAGSSFGSSMMRSVVDDERQQDRLELARERQAAAAEQQKLRLEAAADRTAARGEGGGGGLSLKDIGEGGAAEGMVARQAGMTVPELRAYRSSSETGNVEPFKREVTRYGRDQDDGMAGANDEYSDAVSRKTAKLTEEKVRELPPGFDQEYRDKLKTLSKIEESYALGKNYDSVTKGRQTQQEVDATKDVMDGRKDSGLVGTAIAAGQGKDLYGGDSNVTRQKFTGSTTNTLVGDSQVRENNAQAGQAAAAGRKSDADASRINDRSDPETMRMRADYTQRERTLRTQLGKAVMADEKEEIQKELGALLQERKDFEAQAKERNPKAASAPKTGDNAPSGLPKNAVQVGTSGGKPVYETPDGKRYIQK